MHRSSKKFDFYLFADDTNLLYAEKDLNKLEAFVIFHPYQRKLYPTAE